jgi:transcriptional regulator with XRE-family HTH domain
MINQTNLEKLKRVDSKSTSGWVKKSEWRKSNESWLDESFRIGVEVLEALRNRGMSQADLAKVVGVSPQQINKIVRGTENLTLETKHKLGRALGIELGNKHAYRSGLDKAQFVRGFYQKIQKGSQSFNGLFINYANTITKYDESKQLMVA